MINTEGMVLLRKHVPEYRFFIFAETIRVVTDVILIKLE